MAAPAAPGQQGAPSLFSGLGGLRGAARDWRWAQDVERAGPQEQARPRDAASPEAPAAFPGHLTLRGLCRSRPGLTPRRSRAPSRCGLGPGSPGPGEGPGASSGRPPRLPPRAAGAPSAGRRRAERRPPCAAPRRWPPVPDPRSGGRLRVRPSSAGRGGAGRGGGPSPRRAPHRRSPGPAGEHRPRRSATLSDRAALAPVRGGKAGRTCKEVSDLNCFDLQ